LRSGVSGSLVWELGVDPKNSSLDTFGQPVKYSSCSSNGWSVEITGVKKLGLRGPASLGWEGFDPLETSPWY